MIKKLRQIAKVAKNKLFFFSYKFALYAQAL